MKSAEAKLVRCSRVIGYPTELVNCRKAECCFAEYPIRSEFQDCYHSLMVMVLIQYSQAAYQNCWASWAEAELRFQLEAASMG